ncbi:hypothetical protein TNCV_4293491 [Trichonephila clavipes]|uniref:Transposase n=1 Tax=Trichonephila clavipes TaxID=2585209 RepID=A0A8X6V5W5_TRICX|nr:hypothetical protein TNCV_4293491 [Trichonephila clavipes]
MVCIPLTPRHRVARKMGFMNIFCLNFHDWSHKVLFTDESRFSFDTRRVLVWRDRGTRNNPAFVRERSQYRRAGWMVSCSNFRTYGPHIIRNGTLMGRRYAEKIHFFISSLYAGAIDVPSFFRMIMPELEFKKWR